MSPAAALAQYTRSGFVEGTHYGHAVVVAPDGSVRLAWGDPDHVIFPRSSNKPMQATAMVACGLEVETPLLALAASSHSGEAMHLAGVDELLERASLTRDSLQTPADYPLDPVERDDWIARGEVRVPRAMNCSGKHAAMLLTCVTNGWPTDSYLDPDHPLHQRVRDTIERLSGDRVADVGVDGCGAPVMSLTVAGLARGLSRAVQADPASPERRVVDAMRAHPDLVGGSRRDVTAFMRSVPGLVAKDGAEGVYVAALPDGTAIAIKVDDGADRARQVVLADLLAAVGVPREQLGSLGSLPLLGGGRPVGAVVSCVG